MIEIRPLTAELTADAAVLAREVNSTGPLGEIAADPRRTIVRWQWLEGNPTGGAPAWVALHGSRVVGHVGVLPVDIVAGGVPLRAAWARDLLVHPDWRRAGLGSRLIQTAHESTGHLLLGGLNPAVSRMYHRLGYVHMGPIPLFVRPLPDGIATALGWPPATARALRAIGCAFGSAVTLGRRPSVPIEEVADLDERFDAWWRQVEPELGCVVRRTTASMRWRYRGHPTHEYRILVASDARGLRGVATLRMGVTRGLRTGHIVELLTHPRDHQALHALISGSVRLLEEDRPTLIRTNATHPAIHRALVARGFLRVPANFHWMRAPPARMDEVRACARWTINAGDSDLDAL